MNEEEELKLYSKIGKILGTILLLIFTIFFIEIPLIKFIDETLKLWDNEKIVDLSLYFNSALLQVYVALFGLLLIAISYSVQRNAKKIMESGGGTFSYIIDEYIGSGNWYLIGFTLILVLIGFIISNIAIMQNDSRTIRFLINLEVNFGIILSFFIFIIFIIIMRFIRISQEIQIIKHKE
jgi:hypothetical protein